MGVSHSGGRRWVWDLRNKWHLITQRQAVEVATTGVAASMNCVLLLPSTPGSGARKGGYGCTKLEPLMRPPKQGIMNLTHACATAAICVALFGLSACWQGNKPKNDINVEAPLDISKASNRLTLDFEATPEHAGPYNVYMVNLTFDRTDENDPLGKITGHPPGALLPFKVHVVRLLDGKEVQVESIEGSPFAGEIDPSRYSNFIPEDRQSGVYYSFVYASNWPKGYVCLFRFVLKESGKYQARIETIQDQPIFDGVKTIVAVKKRFNLGK